MNISEILDAIGDKIVARNCFLVEINISKDNDIEITVDSENGYVTLDDCVEINNAFEEKFDREKEDYSLTVTSAGLDQPFKVLKQYIKAIGTQVEVSFKGGRKIAGELISADQDGIGLRYSAKEAVEGRKKKMTVQHEERFPMEQVNEVRPLVIFE